MTRKEKAFALELLNDPKISATEAAMRTYDVNTRKTAGTIAVENMAKPRVLAVLEAAAPAAELKIREIMNNRKDKRLSFDAARDILDRTHGKATQRMEVQSTSLNLTIDLSGKE